MQTNGHSFTQGGLNVHGPADQAEQLLGEQQSISRAGGRAGYDFLDAQIGEPLWGYTRTIVRK